MLIRNEEPDDHDAVGTVVTAAFGNHGVVVAQLVRALRKDDPDVLSLVAEEDGAVVGHVMFSKALVDAPERLVKVRTLSPLAVAPRWQRRGIGKALIAAGLKIVDQLGVPLVFLEGDPAYYSRWGFTPGVDDDFRKPSLRIPDPGFQVIKLSAYEPWMTGTFVYSNTFWDHDCVGQR
jgi:putative acetyltransferase